jgi:hypothetical protein
MLNSAAYPNRLTHGDFIRRFSLLSVKPAGKSANDPRKAAEDCRKLLEVLLKRSSNRIVTASGQTLEVEFAIGRTKVYFGKGVLEFLEDERHVPIVTFGRANSWLLSMQVALAVGQSCLHTKVHPRVFEAGSVPEKTRSCGKDSNQTPMLARSQMLRAKT